MTDKRPPSAVVPHGDGALLYDYRATRRMLGGIAQSTLEQLVALGPNRGGIASVTVGMPGSRKPRRMFRPEDIAAFVESRRLAS